MTDIQKKLFNKVLDLNWDYENETDLSKKEILGRLLREKKLELKLDMGEEAYLAFMNMGRQMFAPKN